jgi:hypothetical protein
MFGIGKGKVLREGAQAHGVVVESRPPAGTATGGVGNIYHVKVRVHFKDGSTADVSSGRLDRHKVGWKLEGDIVPVRYDPEDRSKIEIDVPALIAARGADFDNAAQLREAAIARGEDQLARGVVPGTPSEPDQP